VPNNFVLALAQYPTDMMHLVYSPTGKDRIEDLSDTSFSFFDGMFIGSPNGGVQVLAVEKGSYADQAGIKAGDEITAVGATPMSGSLTQFASAFSAAKRVATDNEQSNFNVTVRSGGAASRRVAISMPPQMQTFLNGGL
jgi:C-terminal processing protease CtpA/Prc